VIRWRRIGFSPRGRCCNRCLMVPQSGQRSDVLQGVEGGAHPKRLESGRQPDENQRGQCCAAADHPQRLVLRLQPNENQRGQCSAAVDHPKRLESGFPSQLTVKPVISRWIFFQVIMKAVLKAISNVRSQEGTTKLTQENRHLENQRSRACQHENR
jgi:hypothetical protein